MNVDMNTETVEADVIPQFREWLHGLLRAGVVTVEFIKSDGTLRVLRCTLQPELLPQQPLVEGDRKSRRESEATLAVWDVEGSAWRSFRLDRVRRVTATLGDSGDGDGA